MAFRIKLERRAQKELNRLPAENRLKIETALVVLSGNPFIGKKMKGWLQGSYSYRVWPYRIVYKIYKEVLLVVVLEIGHRKDIYK